MSKKDKVVYKEKVNWKKEAALLPGYLIVLIWIAFTAVFLIWTAAFISPVWPTISQLAKFMIMTSCLPALMYFTASSATL